MNKKALFADIKKLRNNKGTVDDKAVKKAKKKKKAPPPAKDDKITKKINKNQSKPQPSRSRPKPSSSSVSSKRSVSSSNKNVSGIPSFRLPFPNMPNKDIKDVDVNNNKSINQTQQTSSDDITSTISTNTSNLTSITNKTEKRRKKKKKKKKKRYNNDDDESTQLNIGDDNLNSLDYQKLAAIQDDDPRKIRAKTNLTELADRAYPDAQSIFDFSDKPPLLILTYLFAFIASIDMMVNIPTLYQATLDAEGSGSYYYAFVFLVYVLAQFVSTLLVGCWIDRRPIIEILSFLNLCILIGNIIYTMAVHNANGLQMLIGRGICGVGSSILVVGYAHVTRYSNVGTRESRILYFRFVIAVGTIIGPLIGTILGRGTTSMGFWDITAYNSGSFAVSCIAFLYLLTLITFCIVTRKKEQKREIDRALWGRSDSESQVIDDNYAALHRDVNIYIWQPHRFCSIEAAMLWFLYTTCVFTFWSFEGAIIPVGGSAGSNPLTTTAIYAIFVYIGICFLLSFGLNKLIFSYFKISREKRVIISIILMIFGSIFLTSFGTNSDAKNIDTWQIIVATPFLTAGFCSATITLPALYVSLVGAGVGGLGLRMSWFFSLASFGVLFGPIYGFLAWKKYGSVNFISHTSSLLLILALLVGFLMIKTANDKQPMVKSSQDFADNIDDKVDKKKSKKNDLNQGLLTDRL